MAMLRGIARDFTGGAKVDEHLITGHGRPLLRVTEDAENTRSIQTLLSVGWNATKPISSGRLVSKAPDWAISPFEAR
jgi:hypothetical protein